jgi:hypothetical protein
LRQAPRDDGTGSSGTVALSLWLAGPALAHDHSPGTAAPTDADTGDEEDEDSDHHEDGDDDDDTASCIDDDDDGPSTELMGLLGLGVAVSSFRRKRRKGARASGSEPEDAPRP